MSIERVLLSARAARCRTLFRLTEFKITRQNAKGELLLSLMSMCARVGIDGHLCVQSAGDDASSRRVWTTFFILGFNAAVNGVRVCEWRAVTTMSLLGSVFLKLG